MVGRIILTVIGAAIVIGIGYVVFSPKQSPTKTPLQPTSSITQKAVPSGQKKVLFFYANWCPTCAAAQADFEKNKDKIPQNISLVRVNYNDTETDQSEKDLAKKYGITYQHTFVQVDENGNEITKWNGGATAELLQNIR